MNHPTLTLLGIAGSLRRSSYNRALLRAAKQLAPDSVHVDILALDGLPSFTEDQEHNPPPVVVELKRRIRAADGLLFATPEYNHSIPGVMKNAIDWASRPAGDSSWAGKPAAIMGATLGSQGTVHAQDHLREVLRALGVLTLTSPEVMISRAADKFDEQGDLAHPPTREAVRELVDCLARWTRLISVSAGAPEPLAAVAAT